MPELLLSCFTVGLLGSLHCAGMCGPLAVAVSCGDGAGRPTSRLAAFLGGKLATYTVLGVAAGTVGSAFGAKQLGPRAFAVLAVVAGAVMVLLGARTLWQQAVPLVRIGAGGPGSVSTLLSAALKARGQAASLAAGALAGLLPCGLVWAMVARSLTAGHAAAGGLVMASFGLGTVPSLAATGLVSRLATGRTRRLGEVAAALGVLAMGVIGIWRGVNWFITPESCPFCHPHA